MSSTGTGRGDPVCEAEPAQSGTREQRCIRHAVLEPAQTRIDIAPVGNNPHIRAQLQNLRLTPQGGCADNRALGQIGQRAAFEADEGVAHILARQIGANDEAIRQHTRHVLHRVHGQIDAAGEQSFLDLLGKQPFATSFRQRSILDAIAGRLDDDGLQLRFSQGMRAHQAPTDLVCLGECQHRSAGPDAYPACLQAVCSGC